MLYSYERTSTVYRISHCTSFEQYSYLLFIMHEINCFNIKKLFYTQLSSVPICKLLRAVTPQALWRGCQIGECSVHDKGGVSQESAQHAARKKLELVEFGICTHLSVYRFQKVGFVASIKNVESTFENSMNSALPSIEAHHVILVVRRDVGGVVPIGV